MIFLRSAQSKGLRFCGTRISKCAREGAGFVCLPGVGRKRKNSYTMAVMEIVGKGKLDPLVPNLRFGTPKVV